MPTLLLRLAAPLQAWGLDSKFEVRKTNREPTKSGVVGLLAAALGMKRDNQEGLQRLNQLRFAVRVDQEGNLLTDFHMVRSEKSSYVTYRYYLEDAVFLAGLESENRTILEELEQALHYPVFPLFLGRRSCPPTLPLCLGVRETGLLETLSTEPWQGAERNREKNRKLRILIDANPAEYGAVFQKDLPLSFHPVHRQYGYRNVRELEVALPQTLVWEETEHDPFAELE